MRNRWKLNRIFEITDRLNMFRLPELGARIRSQLGTNGHLCEHTLFCYQVLTPELWHIQLSVPGCKVLGLETWGFGARTQHCFVQRRCSGTSARLPAVAHGQSSDPVAQKVYCKSILSLAELSITLELARGTNIPRKKIPNKGPPQIPKILYAN